MHYQSIRGGMSGIGPIKLEPQMTNDQNGQSSQQLQSLQNLGPVKLEPQQMQTMRGLAPVKMEAQHSDQSLSSGENFLPSILLQMPRKNGVFPCMEVDVKLPEFFPDLKMHAPDPAHSEDSADPAHSETAKTKKRKKLAGGKVRKDRCGACIGNKQACRDNCICREFFPGDAMTAYKAGQIQTLFHRKGMTLLLASCDPSAVSTCINTMYRTCNLLVNDPVQGPIGPLDEAEKKIKILEKKSRGSPLETIHVMSKSQLDVLRHHRLGHHFLALEREFFPGDAVTAAKARLIQTLFHRKGMTMLLASCDPSTVPTCINTMYRTCDMLIKDPLQGAIGPLDEAEKKIEILEEQLRRRSARETIEQLATVLANLNKRVHAVAVNHEAAPDVEHDEE